MLPAVNIGDWCATVDKVLRSLAMPTTVHDDTEFVRYSICHMLSCIVVLDGALRHVKPVKIGV